MILAHGANSLPRGGGGGGNYVNIGGRDYPYVKIGNQFWLAENLDFKFDGLDVPTSSASYPATPQAMYYNYDEATYGVNGNKYGLLYNWFAVKYLKDRKDTENDLIPGWHVPTKNEWDELINAAGGMLDAANKLKSTTGWNPNPPEIPNGNGTDDYGFSIVPAGIRDFGFSSVGNQAFFWTSTIADTQNAYRYVFYQSSLISNNYYNEYYNLSIRLIKDV